MLFSNTTNWTHYMDDTTAYSATDAIEHVLSILNSFHGKITRKIFFLDILISRNGNSLETTLHRKSIHNDIYLRWESFAPNA